MNIPETVKVLHQTYQIREVDNLHDGAADLFGQVQYMEEKNIVEQCCIE